MESVVGLKPFLADRPDWLCLRPLQYASESGNEEIVTYLLHFGASPTSGKTWTPLSLASVNGHTQTVEILLHHLLLHASSTLDDAVIGHAIYVAAANNHISVLEVFHNKGLSLNCRCDGATPLHAAAYEGYLETVRWLLAKGADPLAKNRRGKQAQAIAASENHEEVALLLNKLHAES